MTVELDVFSGRPNPTWTLSPEETAALAALLKDLPRSDTPAGEGGLGYRGFIISNPGRAAGLPARIRVGGGVVTMEENGRLQFYRETHGIERWLLQQASEHGYGDLVQGMSSQD